MEEMENSMIYSKLLQTSNKIPLTWSNTIAISLPFSTVSRLILLAKRTSASALTVLCSEDHNSRTTMYEKINEVEVTVV